MKNKMKKTKKKNKFDLIWVPRILIIAYILFISLFALDTPLGIGFLIHLIPTLILIAILIFTWKNSKLAGILFIIAGIGTIIFWNTYRDLLVFGIISLIPVIIGILFLTFKRKK